MEVLHFDLSIEELAYAMGVLGGSETASGFLMALLGERPARDIENRLLAASHSLVARRWLAFELASGGKELDRNFSRMVETLIDNDFSIRSSRAMPGDEHVVNYYVVGDRIVEHRLRDQVVSCLETVPGFEIVVERSLDFFQFPKLTEEDVKSPSLGSITAEVFDQVRQQIKSEPQDRLAANFVSGGLSKHVAYRLVEDLAQPVYRGSVSRIEVKDGSAASDRGFLILKGHQGQWILEIVPDDTPMMRLYMGSGHQLRESLRSLWF